VWRARTSLPVFRGVASGRDVPRRTLGRTGEEVSIVVFPYKRLDSYRAVLKGAPALET
jgi:hypothetical protein